MQQRRLRLGDILDDYCPRERRITNHVVVAMIEDEVKQTRCTTCDAEHEYKQAKVPLSRRKKSEQPAAGDLLSAAASLARMSDASETASDEPLEDLQSESFSGDPVELTAEDADGSDDVSDEGLEDAALEDGILEDEGPVHRRLIRATLPRPEGQAPERKEPDFTMRSAGAGGRFDQRNGQQRHRGRQQTRQAGQSGQSGQSFGQPARQGGQRQGAGRQGSQDAGGQRQRNGNQSGNAAGQRSGGRPFGANRGPRPAGGQGRKRGR